MKDARELWRPGGVKWESGIWKEGYHQRKLSVSVISGWCWIFEKVVLLPFGAFDEFGFMTMQYCEDGQSAACWCTYCICCWGHCIWCSPWIEHSRPLWHHHEILRSFLVCLRNYCRCCLSFSMPTGTVDSCLVIGVSGCLEIVCHICWTRITLHIQQLIFLSRTW